MKAFWILWHPQGNTPPTVMFDTVDKAMKTAELMIERIGKGTMYVMKAVGGVEIVTKKTWTAID